MEHEEQSKKVLRVGMLGAGKISTAHRIAMLMDGLYSLEAGVFSHNQQRNRNLAFELGVAEERCYSNFTEMAIGEAQRRVEGLPAIDIALVITPDSLHFAICKCFLQQGFHVVCDKPLTQRLDEAEELTQMANDKGLVLALTHNYSAYAMVCEARLRTLRGDLGKIHLVMAEHAYGSLFLQNTTELANKWRYRPKEVGPYGIILDIGTHAHHLLRFITGMEVLRLSAQVQNLSHRTEMHDNALIQAQLENSAAASIWVSRVATGHAHGLRIRVYGDKASLEWEQENPSQLYLKDQKAGVLRLSAGSPELAPEVQMLSRIGMGHPEGFFSSFANLYRNLHHCLRNGANSTEYAFPSAKDGVLSLQFVEAVKQSADHNNSWVAL